MENYEQNKSTSPKSGMRKILIGVTSIVVIAIVALGIVWLQQGGDDVNITGTVDQISMEDKNIVVKQVKINEDKFGRFERNEELFTISWDQDTEFIIEGINGQNLNAQNEILSIEAIVEINASEQITEDAVLAKSIRLTKRSPFKE